MSRLSSARFDPRSVAVAVWLLSGCALIATLYVGQSVILPIVLSGFLFYALDPIADWLQRRGIPRVIASISVVLALLVVLAGGALAFWPQLEEVVGQIPVAARQLRETVKEARAGSSAASALAKVRAAAKAIDQAAAETAAENLTPTKGTFRVEVAEPWRVSDLFWSGSVGMITMAGQAITVLFLTVFLLIEDDAFKRKLVRQMETLGSKRLTVEILNDISTQIERFIWVEAFTSTIVAIVTGLSLWWLGVGQPAVWGAFAGVMNLVPYVGPLLVSSVLMAVAFLQFGTLAMASLVAGVAFVITTIEGAVLTPHLLSRAGQLNQVAILISIAFWSWLWGVAGMLLAVPILMAVKAICDRVDGLQGFAEFLGE